MSNVTLTAQSLALVSGGPLAGLWCRGVASALMWRSRRRSAVNRYRLRKSDRAAELLLRGRGPSSSTRAFLRGHSASCLSYSPAWRRLIRPRPPHPPSPRHYLWTRPSAKICICLPLQHLVSVFFSPSLPLISHSATELPNFTPFHSIRGGNFTNCSYLRIREKCSGFN